MDIVRNSPLSSARPPPQQPVKPASLSPPVSRKRLRDHRANKGSRYFIEQLQAGGVAPGGHRVKSLRATAGNWSAMLLQDVAEAWRSAATSRQTATSTHVIRRPDARASCCCTSAKLGKLFRRRCNRRAPPPSSLSIILEEAPWSEIALARADRRHTERVRSDQVCARQRTAG